MIDRVIELSPNDEFDVFIAVIVKKGIKPMDHGNSIFTYC